MRVIYRYVQNGADQSPSSSSLGRCVFRWHGAMGDEFKIHLIIQLSMRKNGMRDGCVSLDILFTRVSGVLHTATDSRVFVEQYRLDGVQKNMATHSFKHEPNENGKDIAGAMETQIGGLNSAYGYIFIIKCIACNQYN